MCQEQKFICPVCFKEHTTYRSYINHKSSAHQDHIKRFLQLPVTKRNKITEQQITQEVAASIKQLKSEKLIKPWDWENICRLICKPSDNLYRDYVLLKSLTHHSISWFKLLYGEDNGSIEHKKHIQHLKNINPAYADYWISQGYDSAEAIVHATEARQKMSVNGGNAAAQKLRGSSLYTIRSHKFWIHRGHSQESATEKVRQIQNTRSLSAYRKRYNTDAEIRYNEVICNWKMLLQKTMIQKGYWKDPSRKTESERYYRAVANETRKNYLAYKAILNPDNLPRGKGWELDHRFSVSEGFRQAVSPELIGHWTNLELIDASQNNSKWSRCSITLEQLHANYTANTRLW